jgi:hypothetical protein
MHRPICGLPTTAAQESGAENRLPLSTVNRLGYTGIAPLGHFLPSTWPRLGGAFYLRLVVGWRAKKESRAFALLMAYDLFPFGSRPFWVVLCRGRALTRLKGLSSHDLDRAAKRLPDPGHVRLTRITVNYPEPLVITQRKRDATQISRVGLASPRPTSLERFGDIRVTAAGPPRPAWPLCFGARSGLTFAPRPRSGGRRACSP